MKKNFFLPLVLLIALLISTAAPAAYAAPAPELNQVALALLPQGLENGDRLRWELFSYTLLD